MFGIKLAGFFIGKRNESKLKVAEKTFDDYVWDITKVYRCYVGNEFLCYLDESIFKDGVIQTGFVQVPRLYRITYLLDHNGEHPFSRAKSKAYLNLSAVTAIRLMTGTRFVKDDVD